RRENEYVWMCQQMQNRRYALRKEAARDRCHRGRKGIEDRYRSAPTVRDVEDGNALNFAFWQVAVPGGSLRLGREPARPIPSERVKRLPLRYAPAALTFQLDGLTAIGLPTALQEHLVRVGAVPFADYVKELDRHSDTTLGELLAFMQAHHLQ